jgi:iron complex outermembrane receptor protein
MRRAIAGLLTSLFVSACFAQEDAVVVTATRFSDPKRDLPAGVTVITSDDIRKSATSSLAEILAQFGQVHVRDNTGTPNQQVDLRGFGITGDQNTLVLVDGIRVSENELTSAQLSAIPLESIERIEILRGGGAVLYGGGATGGTINIITRRAEAGEKRGYGLARLGGYGTTELRGGIGGRGEILGYSLDGSNEDTSGYRRNNHYRSTNVAGTLDARGERSRAYLRFGAAEQHLELPGALSEAQIRADPRQASTPGNNGKRRDGTLTLGGSTEAGRHELAADLSYRNKNATSLFLPAFFIDTSTNVWSFLPRAKLRFDALGREHNVVLGMDWERWDYDNRNSSSAATIGTPFSHRVGDQTNQALYAQANLWATQSTRLSLGGRMQHSTTRLAEQIFPVDDRRASHNLEAYEAAVRQGFGAGWAGYAKYGSSFRLANFDENACFGPPCNTTLLEPQKARAGELGVEYDLGAWRARAAVYEMRLENEIYFSPLVFANINLSPTRRRGLELEGAWRATPQFEWRAALALVKATFRSGIYGGVDVTGKTVPLVPRAIASTGVSWAFTPQSRLNVNARYVGSQRYDNDQANTFARQMPAYGLLDAKIEHRIDRVTLALEGRNLLDKRYYSYGIWDGASSFFAYPQAGRALFASLAYRTD